MEDIVNRNIYHIVSHTKKRLEILDETLKPINKQISELEKKINELEKKMHELCEEGRNIHEERIALIRVLAIYGVPYAITHDVTDGEFSPEHPLTDSFK